MEVAVKHPRMSSIPFPRDMTNVTLVARGGNQNALPGDCRVPACRRQAWHIVSRLKKAPAGFGESLRARLGRVFPTHYDGGMRSLILFTLLARRVTCAVGSQVALSSISSPRMR